MRPRAIVVYFLNGVAGMIANIATLDARRRSLPEALRGVRLRGTDVGDQPGDAAVGHDRRIPLPACLRRPPGAADRGIGGVHRLHVCAGAAARSRHRANTAGRNAIAKKEQACAGRGNRACLLLQAPCRPVGTEIRCSGRTYIGSDRHRWRQQLLPPAVRGECGRNCRAALKFICRHAADCETGRMLRQFRDENPLEPVGSCRRFPGEFGGCFTRSFLFCSLRGPTAARPQHGDPAERTGLPLRAVGLLATAGHSDTRRSSHKCRPAAARHAATARVPDSRLLSTNVPLVEFRSVTLTSSPSTSIRQCARETSAPSSSSAHGGARPMVSAPAGSATRRTADSGCRITR